MNTLTDTQLGWLAGMYEGEGSFFSRGSATQVSINSTDKDIIERLYEVAGIGNVHYINFTKKNPKHKDQWRWLISRRDDSRDFLYAIYPLLGERRCAKIDEHRSWLDAADRRLLAERTHGTYAGFQQHLKLGEVPCEDCRKAENSYQRERYRARVARKAQAEQVGCVDGNHCPTCTCEDDTCG